MPPKYSVLPEWVVPAIHVAFGWGGWLLLGLVAVLAWRARPFRWAAPGIGLVLLASAPFLAASTGLISSSALPEALRAAVEPLRMGYEILFCILAVWLGTIWYRNNLGNEF